MRDIFIARQPIFSDQLELAAYELLFRDGKSLDAGVVDHDHATATVLLNAFTELGIERVVGEQRAWVNVSRSFVLDGLADSLPPERVVLELLEDQALDRNLLEALRDLRARGYAIALDDFNPRPELDALIGVAEYVKLDVAALGERELAGHAAALATRGPTLLAEKVETQEEYARCRAIGFDLFQGYFFCRPELLSGRALTPNRVALIQVMAALHDPNIELADLERLIARDVVLSYRLLRYINSAFFGLRREVSSIGRALTLLGLSNIRRWTMMTIFAGVEDKPRELITTALARARFCELSGPQFGLGDHDELFTLGLFSVVDALMDTPMEQVLAAIPFPSEMVDALVARSGPRGAMLACVDAFEHGNFEAAADDRRLADHHLEALAWATSATQELLSDTAVA